MQNLSIHRTSELPLPARESVEGLLGRKLADDEEVGVWASPAHHAPQGEARQDIRRRLNEQLHLMASKVSDAAEVERLADEVCQDVRHPRD